MNELQAEVAFNTYTLYMQLYETVTDQQQKKFYWDEAMYWQDQYIQFSEIDFTQLGIQISS